MMQRVYRSLLATKPLSRHVSGEVKDFRDIPSPFGLPFVGTIFSFFAAGGPAKYHKYIHARHKQLGPIFKDSIGPIKAVFVSDREGIRSVFLNEGKYPNLVKPLSWILYNEKHGFSRGLFFMNGEEWLHHRKIMNSFLLKGDFTWLKDSCNLSSQSFIDSIRANTNKDQPNVEDKLYKWSLDTMVSILVGVQTYQQYQKELEPLIRKLAATIIMIFKTTSKIQFFPARLAEKLQLSLWTNFENSIHEALASAYEMLDYLHTKAGNTDGLLEKMKKANIPKTVLDRIVVDFILAAGDTTAYTMSWILYVISQHKEVQEELRRQLKVDEDTLLLDNIVRETTRLYPIAPFLTRVLPKDAVIRGYHIPANTVMVISIYTSGRTGEYFKDPDSFIPDRWLPEIRAMDPIPPATSLPFGLGWRSCIGKKIAQTQFKVNLKRIVENFEVDIRNAGEIDDVMMMVTRPSQPLKLEFKEL